MRLAMACLACLTAAAAWAGPAYRLDAGDVLAVAVFGEPDLSGEFLIGGDGSVSLPLIGRQRFGGMTLEQARALIVSRLADGFLKAPSVSVAVASYRPFYILGEVKTPGAYPYAEGLTVVGAAALGGGFTYRADEDDIDIERAGATLDNQPLTAPVMPGDVIHVRQRFF